MKQNLLNLNDRAQMMVTNAFFLTWNLVFALFKIRLVLQDKFCNDGTCLDINCDKSDVW